MTLKLPDELEAILIQAADQADQGQWTIGDVCSDLEIELAGHYTIAEIRAAVGAKARLAPETVRDLVWMSRKVPPEKRTYGLSRHQYRACLGAGPAWEEYAQRAAENADDHGGQSAPVAVIRGWIKHDGRVVPSWQRRWEKVIDLARQVETDPDAPEGIRELCGEILGTEGAY